MIPEIGLMIGAYITIRMVAAVAPPEKNGTAAQLIVTVCAIVTILVTGFVMYDLFARGSGGLPGISQVTQAPSTQQPAQAAKEPYRAEADNILQETKILEWAYYQQYKKFDTTPTGSKIGLMIPNGIHWTAPSISGTATHITMTMTGSKPPLTRTDRVWVTLSADGILLWRSNLLIE